MGVMRKTDQTPDDHVRSFERVFHEDERWFVRTREGMRGPFSSRRAAEAEADLFVDTVKFLEEHHPGVPEDIDRDDITVVDMDLDKPPWR
jgi:hypothetical protein